MSQPVNDNPKTPKRSKRKPAMEPLGWDEIVSQPGMGGYLSFLNGPVPLPHLSPGPAPETTPGPETPPDHNSTPSDTTPGAEKVSEVRAIMGHAVAAPAIKTVIEAEATPGPGSEPAVPPAVTVSPEFETTPGILNPVVSDSTPGAGGHRARPIRQFTASTPEVISLPALPLGPRLRIRKCHSAQDGHSLGEEVLYQALWKTAVPESAETRTIVIGWRGMSQLCRMTPKNCKINTHRLIRKLAVEVLSPYNTPESIGTTYRVYATDAILCRRQSAGLEWVVRSRGVEFVDPTTGISHSAHLGDYVSD